MQGRSPGSRHSPTLCTFPREQPSVVFADFDPLTVAGQRWIYTIFPGHDRRACHHPADGIYNYLWSLMESPAACQGFLTPMRKEIFPWDTLKEPTEVASEANIHDLQPVLRDHIGSHPPATSWQIPSLPCLSRCTGIQRITRSPHTWTPTSSFAAASEA